MTQIVCPVVEVTSWGKHPNADTLGITQVFGNTAIFKVTDFVPSGEIGVPFRAVFVPEESLVPEEPRWAFLWANRTAEGKEVREKDRVVKARKIRGIFSCGILIPVTNVEWIAPSTGKVTVGPALPLGADMAPSLGITKFEKPEVVGTGGDNESSPGWLRCYTDIENARGPLFRAEDRFDALAAPLVQKVFTGTMGEMVQNFENASKGFCEGVKKVIDPPARHTVLEGKNVVITEKIHGANARYCWRDDKFWVGSHNNAKKLDSVNIWTAAAKKHNLEEVCKAHPGLLLFGEVFGQVQKGYEYDRKGPSFVLFDILDLKFDIGPTTYSGGGPIWWDWDRVMRFANENDLLHVPELYRGPWVSLEHGAQFADGPTVLGNKKHNREGCVVKSDPEAWDKFLGRVVVKIIGETYLLAKYADR